MIEVKIIKASDGMTDLVETSTTESKDKRLLLLDTNKVYHDKVIDILVGYSEEGLPIAKYSYVEIDKTAEDLARDTEKSNMINEDGGNE